MALITSCPQCRTHFRVTPLHLQAHAGAVRCGRCSHVFNAFSRLSTLQEPETSTLPEESAGEVEEGKPVKPSTEPPPVEARGTSPSVAFQPEPCPPEPVPTGELHNVSATGSDATLMAEEAPVGLAAPEASETGEASPSIAEGPDTRVPEEHRPPAAE